MESALWIADKSGAVVPFRFNAAQERLAHVCAQAMDDNRPILLLIPKSRQMGISTWIEAFLFAHAHLSAVRGRVFRGGLVAHDDISGRTIFEMMHTFKRNLPTAYRREFRNESMQWLRWEDGPEITLDTIGTGDSLQKGPRVHMYHFSEAANYADGGPRAWLAFSSAMGSVPTKNPKIAGRTAIFLESTAKGRDPFFHAMVEEALAGRSAYRVVFLPWYLEPTYTMEWEAYRRWMLGNSAAADPGPAFIPTEEEEHLRGRLALPIAEGTDDFRYQVHLTDGQLTWRRMIRWLDFKGSNEEFQRYYPATVEEAFAASTKTLFDPETVAHYAREAVEPPDRGMPRLDGAIATWVPGDEASQPGLVHRWQRPDPEAQYLIVADPSQGVAGGDPSAAYVLDVVRAEVVAKVCATLEWEFFAQLLEALGYYYNTARLVVENNTHGAATAAWLMKQLYPNLHYHRDEDRFRPTAPTAPGFNMHRTNRTACLDALGEATRSRRLTNPDPAFAQQMGTFVWHPKNVAHADGDGKWRAAAGAHDDLIICAAIAMYLLRPGRAPGQRLAEQTEDPVMADRARLLEMIRGQRQRGGRGLML